MSPEFILFTTLHRQTQDTHLISRSDRRSRIFLPTQHFSPETSPQHRPQNPSPRSRNSNRVLLVTLSIRTTINYPLPTRTPCPAHQRQSIHLPDPLHPSRSPNRSSASTSALSSPSVLSSDAAVSL